MKRIEALAPLSREHHGALILSRLLQKGAPAYVGMPTDDKGKADYAFKFYNEDLIPHFVQEEAAMNIARGSDNEMDRLINEIFSEHKQLTGLFTNIIANVSPDTLDHLGFALETHVRKEERILFPMMQEKCSAETIEKIGKLLKKD